ncbi:ATP-dependent endonuclease [Streptomyces sp. JJ36]|uniref:ATP-dependent nuclease n=1 Tax=Streptomyces sp. JJ36 TaxID=2736645 RepID=UPI001F1F22AD|nr:AAA family ATPase [Streptomyces sp. JJ36]MCF6521760.1 ATP-dependent endonuclease [Streptomyces sp. JJ36]
MKIKRVRIENFRCLHEVDIAMEDITSFLGPTGAGKSTVLRALDWFFNGEKSVGLSDEDLHSSGDGTRITVEVEFDDLTAADREALGPRYAPQEAGSLIVWRSWESGEDKITAKGLAYPPFEEIRQESGAMPKRRAYNALREAHPDLGLPAAGSAGAVDDAMRTWELEHRDQLKETEIAGTHFFGFAGQGKLAELVDFVFVSADLRATEETHDGKSTALGRLLDHAVDRTEVTERINKIEESVAADREKAHFDVYGAVLEELSSALSREIETLTAGRKVRVTPTVQAPKPPRTQFGVRVQDGFADTTVDRQGHGFQRALILAALKHLAERRQPEDSARALCLAIEEPELFQHPAQARTFAQVLRALVGSSDGRAQVMYATHSPAFIDQRSFHQVRRLGRARADGHPVTEVGHVAEEMLIEVLGQFGVRADAIRRRAGLQCVENLAEGFFADVAVLVEGNTDIAVLQACAERQGLNLGARGIVFVRAGGKDNLMLSHAVLTALGVRCYTVFDGDAGEKDADKKARDNVNLLGYLGGERRAWPDTTSEQHHTVFARNLEAYLSLYWPGWKERRDALIASGQGHKTKNAVTYGEAARTAATEPPDLIHALLENVQALARS